MNELSSLLYKLFQKIRIEGEPVDSGHRKFGGIWSEDRWVLNGLNACLQDDGYTSLVRSSDGVWAVYQTGDFPVVLQGIEEQQFKQLVELNLA